MSISAPLDCPNCGQDIFLTTDELYHEIVCDNCHVAFEISDPTPTESAAADEQAA